MDKVTLFKLCKNHGRCRSGNRNGSRSGDMFKRCCGSWIRKQSDQSSSSIYFFISIYIYYITITGSRESENIIMNWNQWSAGYFIIDLIYTIENTCKIMQDVTRLDKVERLSVRWCTSNVWRVAERNWELREKAESSVRLEETDS